MNTNLAYKNYENISIIKNYNRFELITLLYEKLLKNFSFIEKSIKINDIKKKVFYINNSIDIINELINSLDFNQGNISYYLYGIYNDLNRRFILVNSKNDLKELEIIKNVIKELYLIWKEEIAKLD